jgi:parallel beta-helix repeat protein
VFQPTMLPDRLGLLALGLAVLLSGPPRAAASTVIVPDDSSTVQSAIASGADTVLVREGDYAEAPLFERNLVLRGIGIARRPRLAGLTVTNRDRPGPGSSVSGFDVSGTVTYQNAANKSPTWVEFSDCSMDGLLVYADNPDAHCMLAVTRCHLRYASGGLDYISMQADTVDGGVSWHLWGQSAVSIQNCWFRGGTGAAINIGRETSGLIAHNRIDNYAVGISTPESAFTIDGNTISGCGIGIDVRYYAESDVAGNVIRGCGVGIYCENADRVRLVNNTILNASGDGISVQGADGLQAAGNVVGSCAGNGIVLWETYPGQYYDVDVRNNTVVSNRGTGIVWGVTVYSAAVRNNISYANTGWGLAAQPGAHIGMGCNDWFGNGSGGTSGVSADSTDLAVDPMFCDLAGADVRLNSASPLLSAVGCGQIGALGVGCGATPTLVQRFAASRVSDGVRVVWEIAAGATASAVWVERADFEARGWTRPVTARSSVNSVVVELDGSAATDRTYWYRLVAQEGSATEVIGAPIEVRAEARLGFRLMEVGPSPGSGQVRIAFALPRTVDIQISVFDVQGRRVATLASGVWPAGAHEVEWNGRTGGALAPAGLYVLYYRYPGGIDKRAVVRVR